MNLRKVNESTVFFRKVARQPNASPPPPLEWARDQVPFAANLTFHEDFETTGKLALAACVILLSNFRTKIAGSVRPWRP